MQRERSLRALEQEALDSRALESNCSSTNGDQLIESLLLYSQFRCTNYANFILPRSKASRISLLYNYRNAKAIQGK